MALYNNKFNEYYDFLFGQINEDEYFYEYLIKQNDGPALEIGSGTGRLLIPYLKSGLKVAGLEPSEQMIEICNKKAEALNLHPKVYKQYLEALDIQEQYKTIYMPLYVFQNITKREDALTALNKAYKNLLPDGQIIISTFLPWNDPTGTYEQNWRANAIRENNDEQIILSESILLDKYEQIQTKYLKLEIFKESRLIETYLDILKLRYYSRYELELMLENAGFKNIKIYGDYTFNEDHAGSSTLVFVANKTT